MSHILDDTASLHLPRSFSFGSLHFTYMTGSDLAEACVMLAKESVCRWLFFGPNAPEVTIAYFQPMIDEMQKSLSMGKYPDSHIFTIRLAADGRFIGQAALLPIDFSPGAYLIGYQIDDAWWKRGIGKKTCNFLVYYGFRILNAYRLNGDCAAGNVASCRIMEQSGFVHEGTLRRYWNFRGSFHDREMYGLLAEEVSPGLFDRIGRDLRQV